MPQLTLKHCSIADVLPDPEPKGRGQDKIVKINIDEEDFFEMLDCLNPKNIIKYLDMRGISHRDALQVNFFHTDQRYLEKCNSKKEQRILKLAQNINDSIKNGKDR